MLWIIQHAYHSAQLVNIKMSMVIVISVMQVVNSVMVLHTSNVVNVDINTTMMMMMMINKIIIVIHIKMVIVIHGLHIMVNVISKIVHLLLIYHILMHIIIIINIIVHANHAK